MLSFFKFLVIFLTGYFQLVAQGYIVLSMFKADIVWKKLLFFSLIVTTLHQIPYYLIPPSDVLLSIIIYFFVMVLAIIFVFKFSLFKSLIASGSILVISMIIEYMCMGIIKIFYADFNSMTWSQDIQNIIIMRSIGLFMCYFTAAIIFYTKIKLDIPNALTKKKGFFILFNTLIIFFVIVPNFVYFISSIPDTPQVIFLFNAIAMIVLLLFSTFSLLNFFEVEKKSAEIEYKNIYEKTLHDTINSLRSFKHDFSNIILSIQGYALLNDVESIKKFINQINKETTHINSLTSVNDFLKDSYSCYGLLLSKIAVAQSKDLVFNVNVTTKINEGSIDILDFCKVIGVLLDNAIEASAESRKKYIEFFANKINGQNGITIEIINSYSGKVDVEKIFEDGFTTKKEHTGFGLWEVRKIIDKYKGHIKLDTLTDDIFFTQKLTIYYK